MTEKVYLSLVASFAIVYLLPINTYFIRFRSLIASGPALLMYLFKKSIITPGLMKSESLF